MAVAVAWKSISISVVLFLIVNCATVGGCTKRSLSHNPTVAYWHTKIPMESKR